MSVFLSMFVAIVWFLCGRWNYQCYYGWSYHLWNADQSPYAEVLRDAWRDTYREQAIKQWRPIAYLAGPIGTLTCLLNGDAKYSRPVGS